MRVCTSMPCTRSLTRRKAATLVSRSLHATPPVYYKSHSLSLSLTSQRNSKDSEKLQKRKKKKKKKRNQSGNATPEARLTLGDTVPDLAVETNHGKMKLHDFVGDSWTILFSHPGDFMPVCTTEIGKMAACGVKLLGLSCDDVESHKVWIKDIEAFTPGAKVTYPIITDPNREIIKDLNMVEPEEKDASGKQVPSRALHIVGPDKKIKLSFLYPASTGRNMDEVVRVLESLQRASKHKIATPCNWKPGEAVLISPSVSDEQAKEMFPQGFKTADLPSKKDYLLFTHVD